MPGVSTVLVVEDDPTVARLVEMTLRFGELDVRVVGSAPEARELLTELWDAIVLDINLPGTSGLELLRQLRDDLGSATPVVMLSALRHEHEVQRALAFKATTYLTKPFSPDELLEAVRAAV
jgi:two-component system phosphate regulon response regulator PhoB